VKYSWKSHDFPWKQKNHGFSVEISLCQNTMKTSCIQYVSMANPWKSGQGKSMDFPWSSIHGLGHGTLMESTESMACKYLAVIYSDPDIGAEYCDDRVCLCLCVSDHISGNTRPVCTNFLMHVTYGCGWVLLWRRCDMLCTSGFMDDVILAHKLRQLNVAAKLIEAQPACIL